MMVRRRRRGKRTSESLVVLVVVGHAGAVFLRSVGLTVVFVLPVVVVVRTVNECDIAF